MDFPPHVKKALRTIPSSPGVYQYFDAEGKLLYVGKAKNLKKRVSSYFTKKHDSAKLKVLVRKIDKIKTIVVETELDALLLENNLIKKHQPRYNVMLRDDKTYPWICIKKEPYPRVFSTRKLIRDGSEYFGPYPSGRVMKNLLELIRNLYPLRTCNYSLTKENIQSGKFKVCLEYHIGNCLGPCEGKQTLKSYDAQIDEIRQIIKGKISGIKQRLTKSMQSYAENMEFELAQETKEKIDLLNAYQAKSTVVSSTIRDADVYSVISDVQNAYVNYLKIVEGAIVQGHTLELRKRMDEADEDLLAIGIVELRQIYSSDAKEVFSSHPVNLGESLKVHVPQRGEKKELVDLSKRNARFFRMERMKQIEIVDPDRHSNRILAQMKEDLRLTEEPRHIECFDNSNFQGADAVAACVVFRNGKPAKKDYRHFNIKTVDGPDDFASMTEVVHRRYRRLIDEGQDLPQLVIIDGGKGQLNAALKAFDELGIRGEVAILGIAKRLEELFYPDDPVPLYLDKRSETLKVIQQLRNEAHRFGITHHRNKRSKSSIRSQLDDIKGIGPASVEDLLRAFKSVKRIKEASEEQLTDILGPSKASLVFRHFHP
jgi:excinuclease ABC subunit C